MVFCSLGLISGLISTGPSVIQEMDRNVLHQWSLILRDVPDGLFDHLRTTEIGRMIST